MTTFVFRKSYAAREALAADEPHLTEVLRRRWGVRSGDALLFLSGTGRETRFFGVASVLSVTHLEKDALLERGLIGTDSRAQYGYEIRLSKLEALPSRVLGDFVYSLEKVSNFSRPSLHFKHHSMVSPRDVETIRAGIIDQGRSLYFGLLRHLPAKIRAELDLRCQLAAAARGERFDPAIASRDLIKWLRDHVVQVVELARKLASLRTEAEFSEPLVATASDRMDWYLDPLFRYANGSAAAGMGEAMDALADDAENIKPSEGRTWRPHRW